ncbi:MAG: MBL fold metallo-hydrolase [Gemmatimonadetes bacterium]|nr:MBL fold metallo-hydrolase [Gemmatimonadota bacterium]
MPRSRVALLALCASIIPCSVTAQEPRALVARAVAAMGGEPALRDIRAVTTEFHGATFALGQEETPESPARANLVVSQVLSDYRDQRSLSSIELRVVSGAVNHMRRVTAGGIGMLETNGGFAPDGPTVTAGVTAGLRRAPERLLLTALDHAEALTALPPKRWRGDLNDGVRFALGPDTLDLYFDRTSGLLTVTETVADDPILGDRRTVSWYTRWQETGGVKFARQYDVEVNGRLSTHSVFTAVTVNPPTPDSLFVIPDSIATRAQRVAPAITVTLAELAPGVWRAEGGSHHSLVVDQGTRLVVVEAPQSSARIQAVLDTLGARFPGKPVGIAVNTHHHWDHAGGVRGALAAGLPVVTHRRNAAFVRGIATAQKTVAPDALTRRPRAPTLTLVDDSLTLGEGESRVVIYRVPTAHVEGMLAAYVPAVRVLFTSDVLSPGATLASAGSAELVAFAKARGITIERVAGGHGGIAAWADVERAAGP